MTPKRTPKDSKTDPKTDQNSSSACGGRGPFFGGVAPTAPEAPEAQADPKMDQNERQNH